MPYIKKEKRAEIDNHLEHLLVDISKSDYCAGDLNYVFTKIIIEYFDKKGNYQSINDIVGALEGAKIEFYRRKAASYEDLKISENSDVY